jgi:hypothetical protein
LAATPEPVPFIQKHGGLGVVGAVLHPDPRDILIIGKARAERRLPPGSIRTRHVRVVDH